MVWQQATQETEPSVFTCRRSRLTALQLVVLLLCFLSRECNTKLATPDLANGLANRQGRSTLQDDDFFQDLCPNGDLIKEYDCNCEFVAASEVDTDTKTIEGGSISCTPICSESDKESCLNKCPDGKSQVGLCSTASCNTEVPLAAIDVIRNRDCTLDKASQMWDCAGVLSVDNPTFEAITKGSCVAGCSRPQYPCFFPARFGPPLELFIHDDIAKEEKETDEKIELEGIEVLGKCDGADAEEYVCGCQLYSKERAMKLIEISGGQNIGCRPICGEEADPLKSCKAEESQCTNYMCIQGECAVFVGKEAVDIIQSNECSFSEMFNMVQCGEALLVDQPTFESVSSGGCIPGCGIKMTQLRCEKKARFGPSILLDPKALLKDAADDVALAPAPGTETPPPQVEDSPQPDISPESAPSPQSSVDTPSPAPSTDFDLITPLAASPEEASSPSPVEDVESNPIPAPGEAPSPSPVDIADGNPIPEPEEAPAPGPHDDVDRIPTPQPDEAPAPAPAADEDKAPIQEPEDAPAPGPADDDDKIPIQEPEEAPAPAPINDVDEIPIQQPEEAPVPAPADDEDSFPIPEPEGAPAPAPIDDVDEIPLQEPEEAPTPAPDDVEIEDSPAPAPDFDLDEIPMQEPAEGPAAEPDDELDIEEVPAPSPDIDLDDIPIPEPEDGPASEPDDILEDIEEVPAPSPDFDLDGVPIPEPEVGPGPSPENDLDDSPIEEPEEEPAPSPGNDSAGIPLSDPEEGPLPSPLDDIDGIPTSGPQEGLALPPAQEEREELDNIPASAPGPLEDSTGAIVTQPTVSAGRVEIVIDQRLPGTVNSTAPMLAGQISSGAWRDCSLEGTKERSVICRTTTGLPILDTNCNQSDLKDKKSEGVESCESEALPCDGCSKQCATIDNETGLLTGGIPIQTATNETCGSPNEQCNTFPCEPVRLKAGPWTNCSCDTNTQTRKVDCVDGQEKVVDASICDAQLTGVDTLPKERNCTAVGCPESQGPQSLRRLLQDTKASFCDGVTCSGHGECSGEGVCVCKKGFRGPDCQIDAREKSSCPGGVLNAEGKCCQSGVFDLNNGNCCMGSSARLDKEGKCCNGEVDFCGVCKGRGVVDVQGKCCESLSSSGLCCESGDVDQCGVCNGSGSTCIARLELVIDLKADPEEFTSCFQRWIPEVVQVDSKPVLNATLKGSDTQQAVMHIQGLAGTSQGLERDLRSTIASPQLRRAERNPCEILEIGQVSRLPLCGNSFCEIQETPGLGGGTECEADCPFVYSVCGTHSESPDAVYSDERAMCAGHGSCYPAGPDPTCLCYKGFDGDLCDQCGEEQTNVDGFCVKRQRPLLLREELVKEKRIDEERDDKESHGLSAVLIVVLVVAIVMCVLLAIISAVWVKKRRKQRKGAKGLIDTQQSDGMIVPPVMWRRRTEGDSPPLPDGGRESLHPGNTGDPPSQKVTTPTTVNVLDTDQISWIEEDTLDR